MIVNGTEANTLLAAQLASTQRQPAQDPAATAERDRTLDVQEIARRRAAEAPQTRQAVNAAETDDSGRLAAARPDLPRDAQAEARNATERNGNRPPPRGSSVSLFA